MTRNYQSLSEHELNVLGSNVRRIRKELQLSQEKLAEQSGLHRAFIGFVERGERSPGLSSLTALANGLNVSIDELFRQTDLSRC